MSPTLHEDEVPIDAELVRRLVRDQFPDWGDLPVERVVSGGTVNAIYRLGTEMSVRLPLAEWGTESLEREFLWAPRLAPQLPLEIPRPLVRGEPGHRYPFPWTIHGWIGGDIAVPQYIDDTRRAAIDVAGFVRALQSIDTAGAPANNHRGRPLATADRSTRSAIEACRGSEVSVDVVWALAVWERALSAPPSDRPPVWIHGDLWHSNLLMSEGASPPFSTSARSVSAILRSTPSPHGACAIRPPARSSGRRSPSTTPHGNGERDGRCRWQHRRFRIASTPTRSSSPTPVA